MMKAFSLYYICLLVNRSILKVFYKNRIFVAIAPCAFNIKFEGVDWLLLTQLLRIQMIVSKDELTQLKINNFYGEIATASSTIYNDRHKVFLLCVD